MHTHLIKRMFSKFGPWVANVPVPPGLEETRISKGGAISILDYNMRMHQCSAGEGK
jgi:hypothetical protein